jgi:hypothetical protein
VDALVESGLPRGPSEEGLIDLVRPGQHILLEMGMEGRVFREVRIVGLQLHFLLEARDRDLAPRPGGETLAARGPC